MNPTQRAEVLSQLDLGDKIALVEELEKAKAERQARVTDAYRDFRNQYRDDPVAFVSDCIDWKEGGGLAPYQVEIIAELPVRRRLAVRGPHGLGKTFMESLIILWFALTRDTEDWKAISTASAWRQLKYYLWPEIHKWSRRLDWSKVGRGEFGERELQYLSLNLQTGLAAAVASSDHNYIEGAHADHLLYSFDESKAIPVETWDAAEGAFASGEVYAFAVSTPGAPSGRFYDIHKRKPGYEDWWVRHVTLDEAIEAGRISREWADQRKRQWGEKSAVYQNRVLGEFAASDESSVIPLAWIELANERWYEWQETAQELRRPLLGVGVDVADSGEAQTVLAPRYGNVIGELQKYSKAETMETAGRVKAMIGLTRAIAVVDGIGVGAGVVSRLREKKVRVLSFVASRKSERKDSTGEFGFPNLRSEAWWNLREMLDPENGHEVALPPDDELTGDLTAPTYEIVSGGKIQVEPKKKIMERIGRSTDCGDAVMQVMNLRPVIKGNKYQTVEGRRMTRTRVHSR